MISEFSAIFLICFRKFDLRKTTHVTLFWNLSRNLDKISSEVRRENAKFYTKKEQRKFIYSFMSNLLKMLGLAKREKKIREIVWDLSGAKVCKYCRSRQELSNEYLLANSGVDTAALHRALISICWPKFCDLFFYFCIFLPNLNFWKVRKCSITFFCVYLLF